MAEDSKGGTGGGKGAGERGGGGNGGNGSDSKGAESKSSESKSSTGRRGATTGEQENDQNGGLSGGGNETGKSETNKAETPSTPSQDRRAAAVAAMTEQETAPGDPNEAAPDTKPDTKPEQTGFFSSITNAFNDFKDFATEVAKSMPEQTTSVKLASNINPFTKLASLAYSGFRSLGQPEATEAEKEANSKANIAKTAISTVGTLAGLPSQVTGLVSDLTGMSITGEISNKPGQTPSNTPSASRRSKATNAFSDRGGNRGMTAGVGGMAQPGFSLSNFDPTAYASHVSGMQANNPNGGLLFTT